MERAEIIADGSKRRALAGRRRVSARREAAEGMLLVDMAARDPGGRSREDDCGGQGAGGQGKKSA